MTVKQLSEAEGFSPVTLSSPDREIQGAYVGDLLSWVMGRCSSGNAWITIMSNTNVLAVASLTDVSCVVLAEGVTLDTETIALAESKEINVISSSYSAYECAVFLSKGL